MGNQKKKPFLSERSESETSLDTSFGKFRSFFSFFPFQFEIFLFKAEYLFTYLKYVFLNSAETLQDSISAKETWKQS